MNNTEQIIAFKDEMLLLRWGDNSRDGQTVTFQLPGEHEIHPFKHSPSGKKTGKRYMAVLVEINDDETPVVQKPKGGPLSKEAAGLCKRQDFQEFVAEQSEFTRWDFTAECEDNAAEYLRSKCLISSRSMLDHKPNAANVFNGIKRRFHEWQRVNA